MDSLLSMINIDPSLIAKIVPIVVLTMGILSGSAMILNAVAKFTATDADDKAAGVVAKIIAVGQKLVDFLSGNVKH